MSSKGTGAMSEEKKEKSALVPRRRFPEFRKVEAWKLEPLSSFAKRCTAKNAEGEHTRVLTNSAEFGVVDQRDYFDKDIANQGNLEGYYIVEKGDYVYNPRISTSAPVGPISKNNVGTGVMSPLYTVFRFDSSNNDFYAHYFKSTHWHHYMRQASSTGARHDRMSITNDDFMGLPLPASVPKEQQKIADCLSSLDDLITAETQKLDALKTHKKGLMQQLFPRAGETVPRLRFPEFREAGEWEEKTLGQLGELVSGLTYSPDDVRDEGLLVLRSSNVQDGMIVLDDSVYVRADINGANPSKPNDILICVRNGSKSLIGKNAVIPEGMPPCTHGAFMTVFRSRSAKFIFHLFQTAAYEKQVAADLGATINSINGNQLKQYKFLVPEPEEQKVIADCLSSVDGLIAAQSQKIAALKNHKKGLMQQLFPVMDEVPA
jgi:type I restriction enzyme S subunit